MSTTPLSLVWLDEFMLELTEAFADRGVIDTPMVAKSKETNRGPLLQNVPLARAGHDITLPAWVTGN